MSRPVATGGAFGGIALQNFFRAPPYFVVHRKICFKHIVKAKILPPKKCIVPHQILKPGYGPGDEPSIKTQTVQIHVQPKAESFYS